MRENKWHYRILALFTGILFLGVLLAPPLVATAYVGNSSQAINLDIGHVGVGGRPSGSSFTCPTSSCSSNWAGYADVVAIGTVSAAYGSWVVPSLSCPKHGTTYVALWVGIDGYSDSTVEQTGVLGKCSSGTASYSTWYEFYPSPMITTSVAVKPGDVVSASVTYSSTTGEFTVSITNVNSGASTVSTQAVSGAERSSAEWIVERPALCNIFTCRLSTLANFGSASFGLQYTTAGGTNYATIGGTNAPISSFNNFAITMIASSTGPVLAQPSSLSDGGTSFTVAYH